ncbi:MAG: hypothetical protein KJ043_09020 [Anaerolineae bacterium]|nr:hypothetical protein [Anaerolineae bacterium]
MIADWLLIGLLASSFYGGLWIITLFLTYARMMRLYIRYRQLRKVIEQPIIIEQIPPANLHDTQEMKPILRKIISADVSLHIQPDAELEARTQAEIGRHKRNLKRIIDHLSSNQLAS